MCNNSEGQPGHEFNTQDENALIMDRGATGLGLVIITIKYDHLIYKTLENPE